MLNTEPQPSTLLGLHSPAQRALEKMGIPGMDFANLTRQLGVTPKTTIDAQGTLKLHHFTPMCDEVYRVPVLIVTSLVNQPYILAVLWAAIDAAMRGKVSAGPLKNFVCMATPVNSDGLESLKTWMGPDFDEQRVSSSDREEVMIKGGYVGLVAGRGAQMRMWPALEAWLAQRS